MMKQLKRLAILVGIIGIILLIIALITPQILYEIIPQSVKESKKTGAFLWEYEINHIDTLEQNYNFPTFKNIWATKGCSIKRNRFGINHYFVNESAGNYVVFRIQNKDTLFNMDNLFCKWEIKNISEITLSRRTGVLADSKVNYNKTDTIYYTIYRMKEEHSHAPENLIPLFKMTLIPK